MRNHGAALLAQARLVQPAHVLAVQERGGGQDLVDRDHARAAYAHHEDGAGAGDLQGRLGQRMLDLVQPALLLAGRAERDDGEEGRAVTVQARVILVARRLVDLGLAAELRVDRLHGQAVGLHPAVTAALAHRLVDEYAQGRIGQLAALAQAALLRRATLIVDEHGDARCVAQQHLGVHELVPVPHLDAPRPLYFFAVFTRVVRGDDNPLHTLGVQ